jgi:Uma2 family endonuclease
MPLAGIVRSFAMNRATQTRLYTFEDYCALIGEDQKADLIDGVIYVASPDNTDANQLFVWLLTLMELFAQIRKLGRVYGSRVAFRLDKWNGPEPDIAFVRLSRLPRVKRGHVVRGPDLAVEIVSPESVERDYQKKRRQYQRAGVREYWIVDEMKQRVVLLRLSPDRKYHAVKPRKGELHSRGLPGFWLRPEWLWQEPRPLQTDILNEFLARLEDKPS